MKLPLLLLCLLFGRYSLELECNPPCYAGICTENGNCVCSPYWKGDGCDMPYCDSACYAHGTCYGPNYCGDCFDGWGGDMCDEPICEWVIENGGTGRREVLNCCGEHGNCTDVNVCTCDAGWGGERCDVELSESICVDYYYQNLYVLKLTASDAALFDFFGRSVSISNNTVVVGACTDGSKSGSAYIFQYNGTSWNEEAKLKASDAAPSDYFGNSVSISGETVVVGAPFDNDGGSTGGSAYIFQYNGTSWNEEAKLKASDAAAEDLFGVAVSISGDTVVVGVHGDDDGGSYSGSAYIFQYNGTSWNEEAKLKASDAAADDYFGYSVSISGDNTVVVGAVRDDDGGLNSGSAYIFQYNGTCWNEEAKLTASVAAPYDMFGISVSISGDTVVVGVHGDDDGGSYSGSAYIFQYNGTSWNEEAKLKASDAAADDYFGYSVSISGDIVVVGTVRVDSSSAYIFQWNGTSWNQEAKLNAFDAAPSDNFGYSVSISGDIVVVGADRNDDGGSDSGSAYIFDVRSTISNCVEVPSCDTDCPICHECDTDVDICVCPPTVPDCGDPETSQGGPECPNNSRCLGNGTHAECICNEGWFGNECDVPNLERCYLDLKTSVADISLDKPTIRTDVLYSYEGLSSQISIDGNYAIVGMPTYTISDKSDEKEHGTVYMLHKSVNGWVQTQQVFQNQTYDWSWFGFSVSISGDYALVGCPWCGDESQGLAYIFKRNGDGVWNEQKKLTPQGNNGEFGYSVSICDKYAVVGSPLEHGIYIFKRDGDLWNHDETKWYEIDIGRVVSVSGNRIIAKGFSQNSDPSVYIFHKNITGWSRSVEISDTTSNFGSSIAISGDYAVVRGHTGKSIILHFIEETGMWIKQQELTPFSYEFDFTDEAFGYTVDISGEVVAIGAKNSGRSGAVYIYRLHDGNWVQQHERIVMPDTECGDSFGIMLSISNDQKELIVGKLGDSVYTYNLDCMSLIKQETSETDCPICHECDTDVDICVCPPTVPDCGSPGTSQGGPECPNNSRCLGNGTHAECICNEGWSGDSCEIHECSVSCYHGNCAGEVCECWNGWQGDQCDIPTCTSGCGNGLCIKPDVCLCDEHHHGPTCDHEFNTVLNCSLTCGEHGHCVTNGVEDYCLCDETWCGEHCNRGCPTSIGNGACSNVYYNLLDSPYDRLDIVKDLCIYTDGKKSTNEPYTQNEINYMYYSACYYNGECVGTNENTKKYCYWTDKIYFGENGHECNSSTVCEQYSNVCLREKCSVTKEECSSNSDCFDVEWGCHEFIVDGVCECFNLGDDGRPLSGYYGPKCGLIYEIDVPGGTWDIPVCVLPCVHGVCNDNDTCSCDDDSKWTGDQCDIPICSPGCGEHGECVAPDTCKCDFGWGLARCNYEYPIRYFCYGVDSSDHAHVCSGHGDCIGNDTCVCDSNYVQGENCDEKRKCYGIDFDNFTAVCSGHGTCLRDGTCDCNEFYKSGNDMEPCSISTIPTCNGVSILNFEAVCNGHGYCGEGGVCHCDLGFENINNSCYVVKCNGIQWNDTTVCSNNGVCRIATKTCSCAEGWTGYDCEEPLCDGKSNKQANVCSGNGTCIMPNLCNCTDNFYGANCEIDPENPPFYCHGWGNNVTVEQGKRLFFPFNDPIACGPYGECVRQNKCKCDCKWYGRICEKGGIGC